MLNIVETGFPHVAGFRIDGKLEKDDVDRMVAHCKDKLTGLEASGDDRGLRFYVEVERFAGISLQGFIAEVRGLVPHLGAFKKKAVVSNLQWADALTKAFQPIGKHWMEGRHFPPGDEDAALTWAAE
jgi:hypothetical protein